MARANRHFLPEYLWHITHRCHKKEFLLKFARDRRRWLYWLFEAKKRFGIRVLNYMVTSNALEFYRSSRHTESDSFWVRLAMSVRMQSVVIGSGMTDKTG